MAQRETRDMIVATADDLFYRQGFHHTSFADIAAAVGISRGNFYHHFKSKDEILDAVIDRRQLDRTLMIACWENQVLDPVERIEKFIGILHLNREKIKRNGCPIGTLTSELGKLGHPGHTGAVGLFNLFREWLARQFHALGRVKDADDLAMQLLSRSQGAATLYNAFQDEAFVDREIEAMTTWLHKVARSTCSNDPSETHSN